MRGDGKGGGEEGTHGALKNLNKTFLHTSVVIIKVPSFRRHMLPK